MNRIHGTALLVMAMSVAAGTQALAAGATIQTGQWRTTNMVLELTNPRMSPAFIAKRKLTPVVAEFCVRNDDLSALIVGSDKMGLCQGQVSFANGRISGTRTCRTGLGDGTRKFEGSYSATKTDYVTEASQKLPKGAAHSKTHVVSERLGACK